MAGYVGNALFVVVHLGVGGPGKPGEDDLRRIRTPIGDLKVWTFGIRLWIWAEWWGEPGGGGAAGGGQVDLRDRTLWFCAEESGDPRAVAEFVQDFLKRFRPNDSFSIGHAFSCSRLRIDGIGGAIFVTPERIEYLDTFALDCGRRRKEIR